MKVDWLIIVIYGSSATIAILAIVGAFCLVL